MRRDSRLHFASKGCCACRIAEASGHRHAASPLDVIFSRRGFADILATWGWGDWARDITRPPSWLHMSPKRTGLILSGASFSYGTAFLPLPARRVLGGWEWQNKGENSRSPIINTEFSITSLTLWANYDWCPLAMFLPANHDPLDETQAIQQPSNTTRSSGDPSACQLCVMGDVALARLFSQITSKNLGTTPRSETQLRTARLLRSVILMLAMCSNRIVLT